jgi:hypothetical protein
VIATNIRAETLRTLATEVGVSLVVEDETEPRRMTARQVRFTLKPTDRYQMWRPVPNGLSEPTGEVCGHGWWHFARRFLTYFGAYAKLIDGSVTLKTKGDVIPFSIEGHLEARYGKTGCTCANDDGLDRASGLGEWSMAELRRDEVVKAWFAKQKNPNFGWNDGKTLPPLDGPLTVED